MKTCDNVSSAHAPWLIDETSEVIRVICKDCKAQEVLRKDHRGAPEPRSYAQFYKRDILQGNENLFYRYHPEYLSQ